MANHGFRGMVGGLALAASLVVSGASNAAFDGFGKDIPLDSAARQIVPDGWTVDYGEGVNSSATVSWTSAPDWQSALKSAVAKRGYSAQFGTNTVVITKASAPAAKPYSSSPAQGQAQSTKHQRSAAPRPAAPNEAAPPKTAAQEASVGGGGFSIRPYRGKADASTEGKVEVKEGRLATKGDFVPYEGQASVSAQFKVTAGQMLHPVLADWAASAGWKVIWENEYDYRIEADASFGGTFIEAVTALAGAMKDARPALNIEFYKGNNVVVVSNKTADEVN